MSESEKAYHLAQAHFHVFGYIVSTYAKVEQGFVIAISHFLNITPPLAGIICAPYTTHQLRNVFKSLCKLQDFKDDTGQTLIELQGRFKSVSRLRNDIGHNMWVRGDRDGSIKPLFINIREGRADFRGVGEKENDFTLEELEDRAKDLSRLHSDLHECLRSMSVLAFIEQ